MTPTWSRPERAETILDGQWVKCYVAHRSDGKSVLDSTLNGIRSRIKEIDSVIIDNSTFTHR